MSGPNSYGKDLSREQIEAWRSLYYKAEDALTPKGIEQLPILCDMALRALDQSNGPSSELLDLRARIDAIGIEVLGGKYLDRVDEIKRFDATPSPESQGDIEMPAALRGKP